MDNYKWVEVREAMRTSEQLDLIAAALVEFQGEVENPPNTAENPFFQSKYAPLSDILNRTRPLLSKHGLAVLQSAAGGEDGTVAIQTMLVHKSGQWIAAAPLVLTPDKPTPQGAGSAVTYGRRYALSAMLGISSEDDDDGNTAEPKGKKTAAKKPAKQEKHKEPARDITGTAVYKKMWAMAKDVFAANYTADEIKTMLHEHMMAAYGIESSKDLNADQISGMIEWLEGWKE